MAEPKKETDSLLPSGGGDSNGYGTAVAAAAAPPAEPVEDKEGPPPQNNVSSTGQSPKCNGKDRFGVPRWVTNSLLVALMLSLSISMFGLVVETEATESVTYTLAYYVIDIVTIVGVLLGLSAFQFEEVTLLNWQVVLTIVGLFVAIGVDLGGFYISSKDPAYGGWQTYLVLGLNIPRFVHMFALNLFVSASPLAMSPLKINQAFMGVWVCYIVGACGCWIYVTSHAWSCGNPSKRLWLTLMVGFVWIVCNLKSVYDGLAQKHTAARYAAWVLLVGILLALAPPLVYGGIKFHLNVTC